MYDAISEMSFEILYICTLLILFRSVAQFIWHNGLFPVVITDMIVQVTRRIVNVEFLYFSLLKIKMYVHRCSCTETWQMPCVVWERLL